MAKSNGLASYQSKRNFSVTSEPFDGGLANETARSFVVQKHWASRLHYDFRLELDGSMKSWAIPKGPSFDSTDKRMAVQVEDHPISYNAFEGQIPARQYGAGKVIIWDKGTWRPLANPHTGYRDGKLKFELSGHKLHGRWALIRMNGKPTKQIPWLLIKENDAFSRPAAEFSVVDEMPDSVAQLSASPAPTGIAGAVPTSATATATATSTATSRPDSKASHAPSRSMPGIKCALPATLKPELATLANTPPIEPDHWLYEIKFDGYRLLARIEKKKVRLFTRNGNDWTSKLTSLAKELTELKLPDGWYDGEIVALNAHGLPDFQLLQNAFDKAKTSAIVYYLFDLPFCNGHDLRAVPLIKRRQQLQELLSGRSSETIRFSETFAGSAGDILASVCKLGLEGVVGKKIQSHYLSRRSGDWIKLKCSLRQEFVIGGYTDPQGSRCGIGSLLLGVHDAAGTLRYAGKVGTGFNHNTLDEIRRKLEVLRHPHNPFSTAIEIASNAHWVKPELLAEVSFGQWTNTGRIRHAVFHGLRADKPPNAIIREANMPVAAPPVPPSLLAKCKVTHPERIVDALSKTTKIDVIRYYALVAPFILEHLKARPVSLVRAPSGIKGQLFFQKHLDQGKMTGIRALSPTLDPDHEPLMEVVSAQGLLSAAQMNVIEFHTWNAIKTSIGKPDRMIFDLDPGTGVEWPAIQQAALVMRAFLQQLELVSFIKTTGGTGLHVVVPLKRRYDWDTVKDFSRAIVFHMANALPTRFAAKSGPQNRKGKIFIDYLRNGFGATTVAAWSVRARPGMGVSVPITWDELNSIDGSAHWHMANIHQRLDQGNQPWRDYQASAQALGKAMKILGFKPDK